MSAELDIVLDDARHQLETGNQAGAVEAYLHALNLSPGLPAARDPLWRIFYESADAHYGAGRLEDAVFFLDLAESVKTSDPAAATLFGKIHHAQASEMGIRAQTLLQEGQIGSAIDLLRAALEIAPSHERVRKALAAVMVNQAVGYYNLSRFSEGLPHAAEALELDPDSEWAQVVHGRMALQLAPMWQPDETGRMVIPYLEMDVAYACNLHCDGCTHYSDYSVKGHVDFEKGREWLERWAKRATPRLFRMLGGEPTLNPRLVDFVRLAHKLWPSAIREVVSNGFFIDRHPGLFEALGETSSALQISVHEESEEYLGAIKLQKVREASEKYNFSFSAHYGTEDDFYRLYKGKGPTMRPFEDKNPVKAAAVCGNDTCTTLHLGRLWKCPPIAFLNNIEDRFRLNEVPEWQPYLQHKGLTPDASPEELRLYISKPQYFCAMCPASLENGGYVARRYPV